MKRFLKKHFNKFFIGILTLISAIAIGIGITSNYNKSYAYETDSISYTCNLYDSIDLTNELSKTDEYYYIQNNSGSNAYKDFAISLNDNVISGNAYLLINYGFFNNDNVVSLNGNYQSYLQYFDVTNPSYSRSFSFLLSPYDKLLINEKYYFSIIKINNDNYSNNKTFNKLRFYNIYLNNNYQFRIYNIDIIPEYDIGLKQYYDTYYGQIEDNYNSLLSNYNDLQDNYNTLDNNYNDLQSNYDTLEDSYNTLQTDYTNYNNSLNYGIFTYLDYGVFTNLSTNESIVFDENASTDELSLESLIDKGVIMNSGIFNAYYFESNYNPNYDNISFKFYFKTNLFATNLIDFTLYGFNGARIVFTDNNGVNYPFTSRDISDDNIWTLGFKEFSAYGYSSIGEYIEELEIVPNNAEQFGRLYTSSNYYQGYVKGSRDTAQYYNGRMNDLQVEFSAEIRELNNTITSMQLTINSLNEQISSFSSDYGINNMLWTIASTPFESFKNIWNVDFFGVNISNLVTGFLTGLIVIWVIKKLFL